MEHPWFPRLTVGFNRPLMRRNIGLLAFCVVVAFPAAFWLACTLHPSGSGREGRLAAALFVVAPLGEIACLLGLVWAVRNVSRPALVIGPGSVTLGYAYPRPLEFKWNEIACMYLEAGRNMYQLKLRLRLVDERSSLESAPWLVRFLGARACISVNPALFDAPWEDVAKALKAYTKLYDHPPTEYEFAADVAFKRHQEQVSSQIERMVTLDGTLRTHEDYQKHFRRNLIGCWYTADTGWTYTPFEQNLVFRQDGSGIVTGGCSSRSSAFNGRRWRRFAFGFFRARASRSR